MTARPPKVLILGADGFIGRHIAFALQREGWDVLASARRPSRLERMGFNTLRVDLNGSACHLVDFWRPYLKGVNFVFNAAGLLRANKAQFANAHIKAPAALYQAMRPNARGLLLSAVGIDKTQSNFAHYRREGEQVARDNGVFILRTGMVLADTSYGGSSLARSLAAVPFCLPSVGSEQQKLDPIHADDLAKVIRECLLHQNLGGQYDIGGAEIISQQEMLGGFRRWLGLPKVRRLRIPIREAHMLGRIGDVLRLGPFSRDAVTQLNAGVLADSDRLLAKIDFRPRGFSEFHANRPAGTQDLWHARLYLMRPVLRIALAAMWLFSGLIGLTLPASDFLPMLDSNLFSDNALITLARLGGLTDIVIGLALLRAYRLKQLVWIQATMIAGYTVVFTLLAPVLWLLPLGGLLKNIPLLVFIALHGILEDER
jgi:uncharacterized protein YbjT (DUF2867 family)